MKVQYLKQNLDYDNPVVGTRCLDLPTYQDKLRMWNWIIENNLLESPEVYALALKDPTIYALWNLRNNEMKPLQFAPYQDAIANCHYDFDEMNPNRFIVFAAANQIGKSYLLDSISIFHLFTKKNVNIVLVSKSLPQSKFLLSSIRQLLNLSRFSATWQNDLGDTNNQTMLTLENKEQRYINRLICAPSGEGLLGYPVHYLFLDEADFYEEGKNFFDKVALPRTNTTKGQIIVFSSPNPDISRNQSLLWDCWNGGLFQRKFRFRYLDAPWNTQAGYEKMRRHKANYIFRATFDAEFPEDQGAFFKRTEIQDMLQQDWDNQLPVVDTPLFMGIDFAKIRDNTVLTLGTLINPDDDMPTLEVRYVQVFDQGTDYRDVVARIKQIFDYYSGVGRDIVDIGYDATGVGLAVEEFLVDAGLNGTPVTFTLPEKTRMYANFKMLAEQRRIKIVYDERTEDQLSSLVFKPTASGKYQTVAHLKEDMHDDIPDSLACLIDVALNQSAPVSLEVF